MSAFPETYFSEVCIRTALHSRSSDCSLGKPLTIMVLRFSTCCMALSVGVEAGIETRCRSGRMKTVKASGTLLSSQSAKAGRLSLLLRSTCSGRQGADCIPGEQISRHGAAPPEDRGGEGQERLSAVCNALEVRPERTQELRYKLMHRTAAVILKADKRLSKFAGLIVQSFYPEQKGLEDFKAFCMLLGAKDVEPDKSFWVKRPSWFKILLAWVDSQYP